MKGISFLEGRARLEMRMTGPRIDGSESRSHAESDTIQNQYCKKIYIVQNNFGEMLSDVFQ